jgi:hypothetical protein
MTMVLDFEDFSVSFYPRWSLEVENPWTFSSHGLMTLEAVFDVGILCLSHHHCHGWKIPIMASSDKIPVILSYVFEFYLLILWVFLLGIFKGIY